MSDFSKNKKFLFLSNSDSETAKSRLSVSGVPYIKKILESGPDNWKKIVDIINDENLLGVLVKLSNSTMELMLHSAYAEVCDDLLSRIRFLPHIIFVHSSFFGLQHEGNADPTDEQNSWFGLEHYFRPLEEKNRQSIIELFSNYELNVVPYRRNVELNLLAGEFIDSHQSNLIFRFYVPSGKIYADQTTDVLTLFREYLTRSLNIQVRQSVHSTASGTVYEFFGDGNLSQEDVTSKFSDFTKVMDLCITDPLGAEKLLIEQGANAQAVGRLVTDYSKKLRRLTSDIRQERERKILDIRHRLESDLIEVASEAELVTIRLLVDQVIPARDSVTNIMGLGTEPLNRTGVGNVIMNVRPQFINHVTGVVAQEVYGNQSIGPEPMQILELIRERKEFNTVELQSAVYELEDNSASQEKRLSAGRKLQSFLVKVGGRIGDKVIDVGISALQSYIQTKIGI